MRSLHLIPSSNIPLLTATDDHFAQSAGQLNGRPVPRDLNEKKLGVDCARVEAFIYLVTTHRIREAPLPGGSTQVGYVFYSERSRRLCFENGRMSHPFPRRRHLCPSHHSRSSTSAPLRVCAFLMMIPSRVATDSKSVLLIQNF